MNGSRESTAELWAHEHDGQCIAVSELLADQACRIADQLANATNAGTAAEAIDMLDALRDEIRALVAEWAAEYHAPSRED